MEFISRLRLSAGFGMAVSLMLAGCSGQDRLVVVEYTAPEVGAESSLQGRLDVIDGCLVVRPDDVNDAAILVAVVEGSVTTTDNDISFRGSELALGRLVALSGGESSATDATTSLANNHQCLEAADRVWFTNAIVEAG